MEEAGLRITSGLRQRVRRGSRGPATRFPVARDSTGSLWARGAKSAQMMDKMSGCAASACDSVVNALSRPEADARLAGPSPVDNSAR